MQSRWKSKASRFVCSRAGLTDPPEAIRTLVRRLLGDPVAIPTNLKAVALSLEVETIMDSDLPFDGILVRRNRRPIIKLNPHTDRRRQRFTLAHELTHVLLTDDVSQRSFTGSEVERLCNIGASEFLMPEGPAKNFFETYTVSPESIRRFASQFEVSLQAAAVRALNLTSVKGALFLLKRDRDCYFSQVWKTGALKLESPIYLPNLENSAANSRFSAECVALPLLGGRSVDVNIAAVRLGASDSFLTLLTPASTKIA